MAVRALKKRNPEREGGRAIPSPSTSGVWDILPQAVPENDGVEQASDLAMERYAAGNDDAFGELYDLLAPRLYTYFLAKVQSSLAAEELVEETFLRVHAARGQFIQGARVTPWVLAMGRALAGDRARCQTRGHATVAPIAAVHAALRALLGSFRQKS